MSRPPSSPAPPAARSGERGESAATAAPEVVVFEAYDPDNPHQWSCRKKQGTVALICCYPFCAVFGSAIYAPGEGQLRERFGVDAVVSSTGLTLYVSGFGIGPLLCSAIDAALSSVMISMLWYQGLSANSELKGRKLPFLVSNVGVLGIHREYGDHPLMCANVVDLTTVRFFARCAAPCAVNTSQSSYIGPAEHSSSDNNVLFFAVAMWPLLFIFPETYEPMILEKRAKCMRKAGEQNAWAAHELHHPTVAQVLKGHVIRPFSAALWVTVTDVYPVVFIEQRHIPFQLCGLLFLSVSLGMVISVFLFEPLVRLSERVHIPLIERRDHPLPMEDTHLKVVILACLFLPVSLFWFAWTSGQETHWIAPALAVAHFVVDALGTKWGVTVFAFISLGMIPIPFVFVRYGPTLRAQSRHAKEAREVIARRHK
ncbi:hypothetical protein BD413DRAFT_495770 [Trametes elegans]|nr:hypothetical protein BD413DRAFT_495770 [Trametes elegans]